MLTHYHAAEFEVASHRARQRWADNIDRLLGDGPADQPGATFVCAPALRQAHDILLDPRVDVRSSDLHELLRFIRDDAVPADRTPESLGAFVAAYRRPV